MCMVRTGGSIAARRRGAWPASPLGPISFAGQHIEGSPSVEAAISSGRRAAGEVIAGVLGGSVRHVPRPGQP